MADSRITAAEDIKSDSYPSGHPWSVHAAESVWKSSLTVQQGGQGVRPVYVLYNGADRIVSTSFAFLTALACSLTPSLQGRLEMLLFGHTAGTHTLFAEIDRLPPGDHHVISDSGIHSDWSDRIADTGISTPEGAADIFIRNLLESVNRSPAGWLPLTGGVDSRTIASVLAGSTGVRAYTRGEKKHPEVRCAAKIAGKLRLNHYPTPFTSHHLQQNAQAIIGFTGGMVSLDHTHAIHPLNHLNRLSTGIVLPGLNGEYGRAFWPVDCKGTPDTTPEKMGENLFNIEILFRKNRYPHLLTPEARTHLDACRAEYITRYCDAADCARYAHPLAWNDEFYVRDRVRSFTSFGAVIWSEFFNLELPFLDAAYVQAIRTIPPKERHGHEVHMEIIRKSRPELLRIPLYPSGKPMQSTMMEPVLRIMRHFTRLLSRRKSQRRIENYAQWLRDESVFIEPFILDSHRSACGLVDEKNVKGLWSEHRKGADHHRILCRLATIAMADAYLKPSKRSNA